MPAPTAGYPTQTATVPEHLADLVRKGSAALRDGDLDRAITEFEQVITAFPDRPEGHNNLGALYTSLGRLDQAEACFDRVLDLLPGNPNIHYNRGLVRARQQKFEAARLDFEAVLDRDPQDADAHNNLGVAAYLQGQTAEARDHFQRVLEVSPDHANALGNLCDLEAADGHPERAVTLCEETLARRDNPEVRRKLVAMLTETGGRALQRAGREAEKVLAADPEDLGCRRSLGRLLKACDALEEQDPA